MGTPDGTPVVQTPETDSTEEQMFDVNGQQVTLEELQKGYMRQSDYTKKAQDLARERETIKTEPSNDDEQKQTMEWLRNNGVLLKEDLENLQKQQRQDEEFGDLLEANPSLKKYEKAIRQLQQVDGRSYEEVVIDNGFLGAEKLEKAKLSRQRMVGGVEPTQTGRSVADLTPQEYEKRKKDNGISTGIGRTLAPAK